MTARRARAALVALALAVACRGGGGAPDPADDRPAHARAPGDPLPGLVWQTPAQPWRVAESVNGIALAPDGKSVMIASDRGRLVRYDATTGARLGAIQLPTSLPVGAVVALGGDRWFALAQSELGARREARAAFEVAGAAIREIALAPSPPPVTKADRDYTDAEALLAPDGSVVVSGTRLPLAAYDPATWKQTKVYGKQLGWHRLHLGGGYVLADHDSDEWRFDLRTGEGKHVAGIINLLAADGRVVVTRFVKDLQKEVRLDALDGTATPQQAPLGTFDEVGADPRAPRLVVRAKDALEVVDLDGKVRATIALGSDHPRAGLERAAFQGDRMAFVMGSVLRVVDLAAATVSPLGEAPYAAYELAVGDDGVVVGHDGHEVWDLAAGKRVHVVARAGAGAPVPRAPRLVVFKRDKQVVVVDPAEPQPRATWDLDFKPFTAFATRDAKSLVVETDMKVDYPFDLVRIAANAERTLLFQHNWDSNVADLDADRGDALVEQNGRVGVVLAGKPQRFWLRMPSCDESGTARLELDGERAATWSGDSVAIWDRTSGALAGAARVEAAVAHVAFVPGHREVLLATSEGLYAWQPSGDARLLATPAIAWLAVSPDGKRAALGFASSQVAVIDLAAAFAGVPVGNRLARPPIPTTCGTVDVFDATPPKVPDDPPPPPDDGCDDCEGD